MLQQFCIYTAGHLQKNDYVVATEKHCSTLSAIDKKHLTDDALFPLAYFFVYFSLYSFVF